MVKKASMALLTVVWDDYAVDGHLTRTGMRMLDQLFVGRDAEYRLDHQSWPIIDTVVGMMNTFPQAWGEYDSFDEAVSAEVDEHEVGDRSAVDVFLVDVLRAIARADSDEKVDAILCEVYAIADMRESA